MYCLKNEREDLGDKMRPRTFRLKQVHLTRTFYPEVGCRASGMIRCHALMAWACYGDRSSEHVVDHRCQVNKQNFAEGNLEYVTRGENLRRHHAHVRENKARGNMANVDVVDLTGGDDASVDASSGPSVPQRKRNAFAVMMGNRYKARPAKRVNMVQ